MTPNNLDIKAINPKNGEKYSPNLYKFMTNRARPITAECARVYRDSDGYLWLGYRDEQGWFHGVRLIGALCHGRKEQSFAYPPKMGKALVEVKSFWKRYTADGRCAIDTKHDMNFMNDHDRWTFEGDFRSCNWCGKVRQKKLRYIEKIKRIMWVKV